MTSDLITRLSKLDAPDREADVLVECAFNPYGYGHRRGKVKGSVVYYFDRYDGKRGLNFLVQIPTLLGF